MLNLSPALTKQIEDAHYRHRILPPAKTNQKENSHLITTLDNSQFFALVHGIYGLTRNNKIKVENGASINPKDFAFLLNEEYKVKLVQPLTLLELTDKEWISLYEKVYLKAQEIKRGPKLRNGFKKVPFTLNYIDYKNSRKWPILL